MNNTFFKKSLLVAAFLLTLTSCSYHQRNSHRVVSSLSTLQNQNSQTNFQYSEQAYGGPYLLDKNLNQYVTSLAQKLAQNCNLEEVTITVVNSSIPNIWSFADGQIAITRGLIIDLNNEAELVTILSHEITHVTNQHGQSSQQKVVLNAGPVALDNHSNYYSSEFAVGPLGSGSGLVMLKYDTTSEKEANLNSIKQLDQMGYSSKAYVDLKNRLQGYSQNKNSNWLGGYLAKHPLDNEHVETNQLSSVLLAADRYKTESFETNTQYLKSQSVTYKKLDQGYNELLVGHYHEAIRISEEGSALMPLESHFHLLKAKAQAKLGYETQALATLNRAIDLNPNYFDNYLQRGLVKEQLNAYAEAYFDFERSLALLPTAEAYYALGELDYTANRMQQAAEYFKKASISQSPGGKRASLRLKQMGLPLAEASLIDVSPSFSSSGYLSLKISNCSNNTLKSVVIDVEELNAKGSLVYRHLIQVPKDLEPQEEIIQLTNIGPFFDEAQMNRSTLILPVYSETPL